MTLIHCIQDSATDAELQTLSEALLSLDVNNCANLVAVNQQGSTSFHSHRDNAALPYVNSFVMKSL